MSVSREAMQATNEQLLGLLSDAVKNYMTVDETITRRMKTIMERTGAGVTGVAGVKGQTRPGSGKRTPPPQSGKKLSPSASPGMASPVYGEGGFFMSLTLNTFYAPAIRRMVEGH